MHTFDCIFMLFLTIHKLSAFLNTIPHYTDFQSYSLMTHAQTCFYGQQISFFSLALIFLFQTFQNQCICQPGWKGERCDECRPYWICPNQDKDACHEPNECFCHGTIIDPLGLCNNTLINKKDSNHDAPDRNNAHSGNESKDSFSTGGHGQGNPNVPKEFTLQQIPQEPLANQTDLELVAL